MNASTRNGWEVMKVVFLYLALFMFSGVLSVGQSTGTGRVSLFKKGAIRVLILTGENNHDWRATTPLLTAMLLNTGRFDVRVNEEPTGMTSETLAAYDVVVLNYNGPRWGEQAEKAVQDFVRSGKGLVGVHGANWAFGGLVVLGDRSVPTDILESPWTEYKLMIGGIWSDKNPASGHAPRHKFQVKIVDLNHPVAEGLPSSFEADDELYHNMHMAPNVHVLATAYDEPEPAAAKISDASKQQMADRPSEAKSPRLDMNPTGRDEPMLWTTSYGNGRTFYTALGHDVRAMEMPGFSSTFVRGVEWAATGTVKKPGPRFQSWSQTQEHGH